MSKLVTVWPVEGRFIPGVPAVKQKVTKDEAERLVAYGAFTTTPPPLAQGDEAKAPKE